MTDYYRLLGVARDAEPEVIAAAYKALARKYHPDTGDDAASKEQFQALNEAYSVLSDPGARSDYDRQFESAAGRATPATTPPLETSAQFAPMIITDETRPHGLVDVLLDVLFLFVGVPILFILSMFLADGLLQWGLVLIGGLLGPDAYSASQAMHDLKEVFVSSFNAATSQEPLPLANLTIATTAFSAVWLSFCAYIASGAVASLSWENRPRIPLPFVTGILVLFVLLLAWRKYASASVALESGEQIAFQMVQYVAALGGVLASYARSVEERTST